MHFYKGLLVTYTGGIIVRFKLVRVRKNNKGYRNMGMIIITAQFKNILMQMER